MSVRISPRAEADIEEITDYILIDNVSASRKWVLELFIKFKRIAEHPDIGKVVPSARKSIRSFPFGSYVILYQKLAEGGILVVRVVHGARQWRDLL